MHNRAVAGANLTGRYPRVFRETSRDHDVEVLKNAGCGNRVRTWHFQNDVGPDVPAFCPADWSGFVPGIAFRRSGVDPGGQCRDVGFAEAPVVRKLSVLRIRKPWRHFLLKDRRLNRFCPGPRAPVIQQRHWSRLARTMAGLTVLLQYRKNIPVECDVGCLRGPCKRRRRSKSKNNTNLHGSCRFSTTIANQ